MTTDLTKINILSFPGNVKTPIFKGKRPSVSGALTIKGYSFSKYIERRLIKDGLGFVPSKDLMDGVAYTTHIQAIIPKTPAEFLVYCHELGHIKSKQCQREAASMWLGGVCEATLENELNAWLWGIRYYKRLGFTLCNESVGLIKTAFESYLNKAERQQAERVAHILHDKVGIQCVVRGSEMMQTNFHVKLEGVWFQDERQKPTVKKPKPLPQNWKPWHSLREKDVKRQWKKTNR